MPIRLLLPGLGCDVTMWGSHLGVRAVRVWGVSVHRADDKLYESVNCFQCKIIDFDSPGWESRHC